MYMLVCTYRVLPLGNSLHEEDKFLTVITLSTEHVTASYLSTSNTNTSPTTPPPILTHSAMPHFLGLLETVVKEHAHKLLDDRKRGLEFDDSCYWEEYLGQESTHGMLDLISAFQEVNSTLLCTGRARKHKKN